MNLGYCARYLGSQASRPIESMPLTLSRGQRLYLQVTG